MTSLSEKLNYAGWEMQGQDIDEDEEDAEMDVGGEEEEEEEDEAEEVNLMTLMTSRAVLLHGF